jgi:hypothetical protein
MQNSASTEGIERTEKSPAGWGGASRKGWLAHYQLKYLIASTATTSNTKRSQAILSVFKGRVYLGLFERLLLRFLKASVIVIINAYFENYAGKGNLG